MTKTAIQTAIEKIDEQIKIAQVCKIEATRVKDVTSMNRHHGIKIALVFMKQELVNLLELEKQQIISAFKTGECDGTFETINAEQHYNDYFKS